MNNNNAIQKKPKKLSFSAMLKTESYQKALHNALSDPKEIQKFTSAITSVVATNPNIANCDSSTILSSALLGHSLGLVPSPQLGQYYMVPFEDKKNHRTTATFVLGYKGYVQLAIRSGQYKRLNVIEIKEGELIKWDRLTEEFELKFIEDDTEREATETIGYLAYFKYVSGYEKAIYWTKEKMKAHAMKYSPGYASDIRKGNNYTFWSKDFDSMAKKTMLRQLIGKWGIMSVEMQRAYVADGAVVDNDGNPTSYNEGDFVEVDNQEPTTEETPQQVAQSEPQAPARPPVQTIGNNNQREPQAPSQMSLDDF